MAWSIVPDQLEVRCHARKSRMDPGRLAWEDRDSEIMNESRHNEMHRGSGRARSFEALIRVKGIF